MPEHTLYVQAHCVLTYGPVQVPSTEGSQVCCWQVLSARDGKPDVFLIP